LLFPSLAGDEQFRSWWGRHLRAAASPAAARAYTEMSLQTDVRAILPSIHVPTLVMHRTDDMLADVGGARYIAETIPNARFLEFPGDDHVFMADDDGVFAALEEFVTGEPARPRSDRVLATALFVDIVESTDRAVELGDRGWRDLLESHYTLVRRELDRFEGQEIDTAGDACSPRSTDRPRRRLRVCDLRHHLNARHRRAGRAPYRRVRDHQRQARRIGGAHCRACRSTRRPR
jgi:hypothetical protein